MARHQVFISFHHANDQFYKDKFIKLFADKFDIMIDKSVNDGDINPNTTTESIRQKIRDEYLRTSTVTVVLIGVDTWKRKHVDWEISSSLRDTYYNPRSGVLGIILPSHSAYKSYNKMLYKKKIPPRLIDNIQNGFVKLYDWNEDPYVVLEWIEEAFKTRNKIIPDNSRVMFGNNRPEYQTEWTD